jgi:glycosyltransferase involved in cell wall biosynthesis
MNAPDVSFCIPCYNERDNLPALLSAIHAEARRHPITYEIVITDDCSTDGSWELLKKLAREDSTLRAQRLDRNSGESAASYAALKAARGDVIVTLDADLQNDPRDLPQFLEALEDADCVCGTRQASRAESDSWAKTIISRSSNAIRSRVLQDRISDAGCTYRAFRRECVEHIPFFKGVHRFIPILLDLKGFRIAEVPVTNQPRMSGSSHYGVFARFDAIVDMFAVRWMKARMKAFKVVERTSE